MDSWAVFRLWFTTMLQTSTSHLAGGDGGLSTVPVTAMAAPLVGPEAARGRPAQGQIGTVYHNQMYRHAHKVLTRSYLRICTKRQALTHPYRTFMMSSVCFPGPPHPHASPLTVYRSTMPPPMCWFTWPGGGRKEGGGGGHRPDDKAGASMPVDQNDQNDRGSTFWARPLSPGPAIPRFPRPSNPPTLIHPDWHPQPTAASNPTHTGTSSSPAPAPWPHATSNPSPTNIASPKPTL